MDESRPGLLTIAFAAALGASALASGPGTAVTTSPAARPNPAAEATPPSTRASVATTSLTGTVPLTAVPWGGAFERYLKLLQDADASVEQLERARAEFESALGPASESASTASTTASSSTSASAPRTSR